MAFFLINKDIGIDLGHSRTRVYIHTKGVVYDEPTSIATEKGKKDILAIGDEVSQLKGRVNNFDVFSIIEKGKIIDQELAGRYLKMVLSKSRGVINNIFKPDVLVNISISSNNVDEMLFIKSCSLAGVKKTFLEKNIILAGIGVGFEKKDVKGRMIADIGASKIEVGVITLGGISNSKSEHIGGADMDKKIVECISKTYRLSISRESAEHIKRSIGSAILTDNPKELKIKGADIGNKLPKVIKITSNDIAEAVSDVVTGMVKVIENTFQALPPELVSDVVENGIVLTGGVSNLSGLKNKIEKAIKIPVIIPDEPESAIIKGLTRVINGGDLQKYKTSILSK